MRFLFLLVISAIGLVLLLRLLKGLGGGMETRVCRQCGEKIPRIGTFCPICGQKTV